MARKYQYKNLLLVVIEIFVLIEIVCCTNKSKDSFNNSINILDLHPKFPAFKKNDCQYETYISANKLIPGWSLDFVQNDLQYAFLSYVHGGFFCATESLAGAGMGIGTRTEDKAAQWGWFHHRTHPIVLMGSVRWLRFQAWDVTKEKIWDPSPIVNQALRVFEEYATQCLVQAIDLSYFELDTETKTRYVFDKFMNLKCNNISYLSLHHTYGAEGLFQYLVKEIGNPYNSLMSNLKHLNVAFSSFDNPEDYSTGNLIPSFLQDALKNENIKFIRMNSLSRVSSVVWTRILSNITNGSMSTPSRPSKISINLGYSSNLQKQMLISMALECQKMNCNYEFFW